MEILGSQLLPSESDEQSHSNKRTKNKWNYKMTGIISMLSKLKILQFLFIVSKILLLWDFMSYRPCHMVNVMSKARFKTLLLVTNCLRTVATFGNSLGPWPLDMVNDSVQPFKNL